MNNSFSLLSVTNHLNSCKPGNFTCSNLTIETLEKGAKYVVMFSCSQVNMKNTRTMPLAINLAFTTA